MEEEIEALCAIYCGNDEILVSSGESNKYLSVLIDADLRLDFDLSSQYPDHPPKIDLNVPSKFWSKRDELHAWRLKVQDEGEKLRGSPMVLDLIQFAKENLPDLSENHALSEKSTVDRCDSILELEVIEIDHMNDVKNYVKKIQSWISNLRLSGRLIFLHPKPRIFLILQGQRTDVQKYERFHRTSNVDVDSKGRPCKERMMSVLMKTRVNSDVQLDDFLVIHCKDMESFLGELEKVGLNQLYKDFILPNK